MKSILRSANGFGQRCRRPLSNRAAGQLRCFTGQAERRRATPLDGAAAMNRMPIIDHHYEYVESNGRNEACVKTQAVHSLLAPAEQVFAPLLASQKPV